MAARCSAGTSGLLLRVAGEELGAVCIRAPCGASVRHLASMRAISRPQLSEPDWVLAARIMITVGISPRSLFVSRPISSGINSG